MREPVVFTHIAGRTSKHQVINTIARNIHTCNTRKRKRVIDVKHVLAVTLLKFREATSSIIASIVLSFQLILYLLSGISTRNRPLPSTTHMTMNKISLTYLWASLVSINPLTYFWTALVYPSSCAYIFAYYWIIIACFVVGPSPFLCLWTTMGSLTLSRLFFSVLRIATITVSLTSVQVGLLFITTFPRV